MELHLRDGEETILAGIKMWCRQDLYGGADLVMFGGFELYEPDVELGEWGEPDWIEMDDFDVAASRGSFETEMGETFVFRPTPEEIARARAWRLEFPEKPPR